MSPSRVSAVHALLPAPSISPRTPAAQGARPSLLGDVAERSAGREVGQVFVMEHEDMVVSLAPGAVGSDLLADDLNPGDVLLVKVLSTTPRLSLERLGQATQASAPTSPSLGRNPSSNGTSAAMTPDQTAMLRMAWAPPDAASLATSWRVLVLEHLRQMATGNSHEPGGLAWPAPPGTEQASTQTCATPAMWAPLERWLFQVQAWAGLPMSLHLLSPRHSPRQGKGRKRCPGWGLRVSGFLPGLGRIELQAQLSSEGACLLILADDERTWQRLQDASHAMSRAVTRAGWRLRTCQILREPPVEDATPDAASETQGSLTVLPATSTNATALPQALFRVTAEVLITLGAMGTGITPRFR